jgi:hypothetical protein
MEQDKNAFAYVIYEKATVWLKEEGPAAPWRRGRMFYASDDVFDRDTMWDREVAWRDPDKIRVVPLYDEAANDARRDDNLDAIRAQYDVDTAVRTSRRSLGDAVEWALESSPPHLDEFEGLIRTLEAFDSQVTHQLTIPANTVTRRDYLPSVEQLDAIEQSRHDLKEKQ